jgi:hypothetical protein
VVGSGKRTLDVFFPPKNPKMSTGRWCNQHLPTKLGWIAYCIKLWAGVRYGLAALVTPLLVAKGVLKQQNFKLLAFLGVNRNVKREWRTLHRAFGRIGLFSFTVEQMIGMIKFLLNTMRWA